MNARHVDAADRPPTRSEIDYSCALQLYKRRRRMSLAAAVLLGLMLLAVGLAPIVWWTR